MFKKNAPVELTKLEQAIDTALDDLNTRETDSEEYAKIVEQITKLHQLLPEPEKKVSKDTLFTVGGNLLGIFSILGFEKANVVTSKAIGMIIKPKL